MTGVLRPGRRNRYMFITANWNRKCVQFASLLMPIKWYSFSTCSPLHTNALATDWLDSFAVGVAGVHYKRIWLWHNPVSKILGTCPCIVEINGTYDLRWAEIIYDRSGCMQGRNNSIGLDKSESNNGKTTYFCMWKRQQICRMRNYIITVIVETSLAILSV